MPATHIQLHQDTNRQLRRLIGGLPAVEEKYRFFYLKNLLYAVIHTLKIRTDTTSVENVPDSVG